ncbi:MAG: 23S rRNA (guanosine(2251)-2'-O)-methyltransferase RlmB [Clostridiales bacterium]|nr:23S rRNA (guanosine(2251)-2'-O)-methyltransferase RlmB [Clostridiales bacterium]
MDYEAPEIPEDLLAEFKDVPFENENLLVGRNPIREAIRAGRPMEKLLVASGDLSGAAKDIIKMAKEANVIVQYVDRTRLDQLYPAHQGMLAYVAAVPYVSVEEILENARSKNEDPFIILLDGITDPHNLGAIIRSAECAGAHGVIVPERRAAGLGPTAAKAAAGALNHMPIARVKNLNRTIEQLQAENIWVIGTAMDGEDAFKADLTGPVALVIGSEGDGISRLTLEKCDRKVTLPMKGHIESLNASVAAGVLMYAIARARAL